MNNVTAGPSPVKKDALPVLIAIVVLFLLVAALIILAVQLQQIRLHWYREALPQDMEESGVPRLTWWNRLGSLRKSLRPSTLRESQHHTQCSCQYHLPCGNMDPNVIEITYL